MLLSVWESFWSKKKKKKFFFFLYLKFHIIKGRIFKASMRTKEWLHRILWEFGPCLPIVPPSLFVAHVSASKAQEPVSASVCSLPRQGTGDSCHFIPHGVSENLWPSPCIFISGSRETTQRLLLKRHCLSHVAAGLQLQGSISLEMGILRKDEAKLQVFQWLA